MTIPFSHDRWQRLRQDYTAWWKGDLGRPIIQVTLTGCDAGRPAPKLGPVVKTAEYGLQTPIVDIIDRWDWELSSKHYLGDAFPHVWPNFGPGAMARFIGAKMEVDTATVWYKPHQLLPIEDLEFKYSATDEVYCFIRSLYRGAEQRWEGLVQLAMTDLGGNLDLLSTFRPSEHLLMDLIDSPEQVERLTWQLHDIWWRYFNELDSLTPLNPGYTAWAPILSPKPYYMLQCDFCYMIGEHHFEQFVKPELEASARRLANAFYHLDGPGEVRHLDSLLTIENLKGVQWIPGAGNPDVQFGEIFRKIRKAGKLAQVVGRPEKFDAVVKELGSAEGLFYAIHAPASQEEQMKDFLRKYGVPVED